MFQQQIEWDAYNDKPKLRVGVLYNPHSTPNDSTIRTFHEIMRSHFAELVCLFVDGRNNNMSARTGLRKQSWDAVRQGPLTRSHLLKFIRYGLLNFIRYVERRHIAVTRTTQYEEVKAALEWLPVVPLQPSRRGFVDHFSDEDARAIREHEIDVLLRHEFGILRGPILCAPRFGIWSFHYADNVRNRGGPAGFWECFLAEPVTGATLQVLEDELDGGRIIEKGYYNTQSLWLANNAFVREKSVNLLLKNLRLLWEDGQVKTLPSPAYTRHLFREPSASVLTRYIFKKYGSALFSRYYRTLRPHNYDRDVWKIHIGRGAIDRAVLWRTRRLEPPPDHFWADPFLINVDDEMYLFFENYDYRTQKGRISWARLDGTSIVETGDALESEYHLSYPFLWREADRIYMIPEVHAAGRVEVWRAAVFPKTWVRHATLFERDSCGDTSLYRDDDGVCWCFTNKSTDKFNNHDSELYIYRVDDLEKGEMIPHKRNPVISDSRVARNAGPIFINAEGETIRPAQINQSGIYGYGLNLCRIDRLTLEDYQETVVQRLLPDFEDGAKGMHHAAQAGDYFVIDVCYTKR
jgi:hypothetical protein